MKKLKLFCLFVAVALGFALLSSPVGAQPNFQKRYLTNNSLEIYAPYQSIIQTPDSGYVFVTRGNSIYKINEVGDTLWSYRPSHYWPYCLAALPSGEIAAAGSDFQSSHGSGQSKGGAVLVILDRNGNRILDTSIANDTNFSVVADSGAFIVYRPALPNTSHFYSALLRRVAVDGSLISSRSLPGFIKQVISLSQGPLVLTTDSLYALRHDLSDRWSKPLSGYLRDSIVSFFGLLSHPLGSKFMLCSYQGSLLCDSLGNVILRPNVRIYYLNQVALARNDDLLLTGTTYTRRLSIERVQLDGSLTWQDSMGKGDSYIHPGFGDWDKGIALANTFDDGVSVLGAEGGIVEGNVNGPGPLALVVKTDRAGNTDSLSEANSVVLPQPASDLAIYPNPVTDIINVPDATGAISVVDMLGRKLIETRSRTVDVRALPSGVYYVVSSGARVRFVKK